MRRATEIGDLVDAVEHEGDPPYDSTFFRDVWHPCIECDGRMMAVVDDSTASGRIECATKDEALQRAVEIRDAVREQLEKRSDQA